MSYTGASIASVVTAFLAFIIGFYFVSKNFKLIPLHRIFIKPVFCGLIMGTFVYFLDIFLDINIFLLIFCAAVIYLFSSLLLKTFSEEDIDVIEKLTGRDMRWVLKLKYLINRR